MRSTAISLAVIAMLAANANAQIIPLVPPKPLAESRMGRDVAATAEWVVASTLAPVVGEDRVYVFQRNGDGWAYEAELTYETGLSGFRGDVEASGACAAAAAPWDNYYVPGGPNAGFHAGSVYVYCRSEQGWTLDGTLRPADPTQDGLFGLRIAINGDIVASQSVGGYLTPPDSMAVYIHRRGEAGWEQEAKLQLNGLPDVAPFGQGLTASSNLVGAALAVYEEDSVPEESYRIFAHTGDGWVASDTLWAGSFGGAVLAGGRLFLGDPGATGPEGYRDGAVRIFRRAGNGFVLEDSLRSDRPLTPYPYDEECPFGQILDATEDLVVAAHHCGSIALSIDTVEVFAPGPSGWERIARGALGLVDPSFRTFALSGDDLVVGLPQSDEHGVDAGAAYVVPLTKLATALEPIAPSTASVVEGPYPNPTRGPATFRIRAESPRAFPLDIQVMDVLGRVLVEQAVELATEDGTFRMDLSHLASGIYVVRVMMGEALWTSRVIVAR